MKKAQSATEFVILTSVMFIFFIFTTIYVQSTLVDATYEGKVTSVAAVEDAIEQEIIFADQMPSGYTRTFTLPDSIQGIPYTITVYAENDPLKDALVVTYSDESVVRYLRQNVTGTLHPGINTLNKTSVIKLN